jgi:hypothetical protein
VLAEKFHGSWVNLMGNGFHQVAVKGIDDRGNELLVVKKLAWSMIELAGGGP